MSAPPAPDDLRRRAERALSPGAPEPLRAALRRARLRLEPDVEGWDASTGRVRAHRVGFGTDAATLARLRRAPSLFELLGDAFAAAVALDEGQSLFDLRPYWGLGPAPPAASPYRGEGAWPEADPGDGEALREAAVAYVDALGDPTNRRWLEGATLTVRPEGEGVRLEARGEGPCDAGALERALADLLQGFDGRPVVVRLASR